LKDTLIKKVCRREGYNLVKVINSNEIHIYAEETNIDRLEKKLNKLGYSPIKIKFLTIKKK